MFYTVFIIMLIAQSNLTNQSNLTFAVNVSLISTVIYFPAKKRMVLIKLEPTYGV